MRSYLTILLVSSLVFALGYGFLHLFNRPVERIAIKGDLSPDERVLLKNRFESEFQGRILDFDLFSIVNSVKDEVQWIHSINIDRDWPATLVLNVEKIAPIAKWSHGHYISWQGQVIRLESDRIGLPEFKVVLSSPIKSMEVFRDLTGKLKPHKLSILEISESALGEWAVKLSNGLNIQLGHDNLDKRLNKSLSVYNNLDLASQGRLEFIDARYIGGVALRKTHIGNSGYSLSLSNID